MEQSGLKLRISRMFRSSFGSCRTRHISDVNEKAVLATQPPRRSQRKSFQQQEQPLMTSPKARPFPSICKPRCPDSGQPAITNSYIRVSDETLRRRPKVCRHSSPISPSDFYSVAGKKNKNRSKRKAFSDKNNVIIKREAFPFSSSSGWWLSSDDEREDETDNLFSSRTLSSDSSESRRRRTHSRPRRTRKTPATRNSEVGLKVSVGKVKDSFAVVKSSSDPYSDFRTSMVEMIVEKQIFGAADQEKLLQCFLSLNSRHHHKIIVHVFTEIREALFCNWR